MNYQNKYGTATLIPVGEIVHVSTIKGATVIDSGLGFDLETAEKLALITENIKLQPSYNFERKGAYVLRHHSSDQVQVCRLDSMTYTGGNPAEELSTINKCQSWSNF